MPKYTPEIGERVERWLRGEHEYQFAKNLVTHRANAQASLTYIEGTELANKWQRFQLFESLVQEDTGTDNRGIQLQAAQMLLKTCSAARGALVWRYILNGRSVPESNVQTWDDLWRYYEGLSNGSNALPQRELLELPLEAAISPAMTITEGVPSTRPVFTHLAGLAVVYFADQHEREGEITMPKPGTPSGQIENW